MRVLSALYKPRGLRSNVISLKLFYFFIFLKGFLWVKDCILGGEDAFNTCFWSLPIQTREVIQC